MATIKQIKKRTGSIVTFDHNKITEAIWKAAQSVGGSNKELAESIAIQVVTVLEVFFKDPASVPTVEQIQDLVEKILIEKGHAKTAKAYILYRHKRQEAREEKFETQAKNTEMAPPTIEIAGKSAIPKNHVLAEITQAIKETEAHLITLKKLQDQLQLNKTAQIQPQKSIIKSKTFVSTKKTEQKKSAVHISLPPIKVVQSKEITSEPQLSFSFEKKIEKNAEEVTLPPIATIGR